ncbi:MAG: hypothetical protein ACRYFZ_03990 [Janthinobacterium lividum]
MKRHLLALPLAAGLLLLGTLGCSKKEEEAEPIGTGSYKLDGRTINCQAQAYLSTGTNAGGSPYDYLEVQLTTTPQPASGPEVLHLYLGRPSVYPNSTYWLTSLELRNSANPSGMPFGRDNSTLSTGSNNRFSGTFAARNIYYTTTLISDGVFTNAHP